MKNLGRLLILAPLVTFLSFVCFQDGLYGMIMFILYVVGAFLMIVGPIIGALLIAYSD